MQIICCIIFCFVNTIIKCQTVEPNTVCAENIKADEFYGLNLKDFTKFSMQVRGKSKYYFKNLESINIPVYCLNDKNYNNNEIKNIREVSKMVQLNKISKSIMIKKESGIAGDILLSAAVVAVSLLLVFALIYGIDWGY